MPLSRRSILRFAGLLAVPAPGSENVVSVQYRARATVLLLSVPLLHRDNVGSGYLNVAERQQQDGQLHVKLEFGAGSLPERAAGLNRLGIFEENVVESRGGRVESANYFGYMTTSNEKDLNQAKAALEKGDDASYTAIRGSIERGKLRNRLLKVRDSAKAGWADRGRLTSMIRTRLADNDGQDAQNSTLSMDGAPCSTFLYAIRSAMRDPAAVSSMRFIHNGKMHQVRTERKKGEKSGLTEMEGKILSDTGKELSGFRLWFEPLSPQAYPLRFEFRARSFLRLTFERV